jgi:hypothetical protein
VTKKTGSYSSHVELLNKSATPDEIQEVWQAIDARAEQ